MKFKILIAAFFLPLFTFGHYAVYEKPATSRDIITTTLSEISKIKTLKYKFKSWERLIGKSEPFYTEMFFKINLSPLKVYALTLSEVNTDDEVLYVEGELENKAKVNAGKWIPNINLSPYSSRMRENQHHVITQAGFGFFYDIIQKAIKRADKERPGEFNSFFKFDGDITWEGIACYKMTIEDPDFTYVNYTVQQGEDINTIEKSKSICGYLILEKNGLKNFDSLKPGMTVKIPTSYAKKTVLYIDKRNNLPIVQIMYDEAGMFEKYEFHELKVNPVFKEHEFTAKFEEYRF